MLYLRTFRQIQMKLASPVFILSSWSLILLSSAIILLLCPLSRPPTVLASFSRLAPVFPLLTPFSCLWSFLLMLPCLLDYQCVQISQTCLEFFLNRCILSNFKSFRDTLIHCVSLDMVDLSISIFSCAVFHKSPGCYRLCIFCYVHTFRIRIQVIPDIFFVFMLSSLNGIDSEHHKQVEMHVCPLHSILTDLAVSHCCVWLCCSDIL